MKSLSAKELQTATEAVLRRVGRGEQIIITKRGKPCAVLSPIADGEPARSPVRSFAEAWADIERTLQDTHPRHKTWQEAMRWTRRRAGR